MSVTLKHTVNPAWTQITEASDVFLQLQTPGPVLIHIGSTLPEADSASDIGVELYLDTGKGLASISFGSLEAGDKVYGRSVQDEDNDLLVVATLVADS